jgi:hypothetical protein
VGIKIWVEVLNDGHHHILGRGRPIYYLSCTLVYIVYAGIELISIVIPVCCGSP